MTPYQAPSFSGGPKLGFEAELNVMIVNIGSVSDEALRYFANPAGNKQDWSSTKIFEGGRYPKQTVLFSSPQKTWHGTADSSSPAVSNLEFVSHAWAYSGWQKRAW